LAGSRLRLIGVDDQIMRTLAHFPRHEGPLQTRRETCPASSAQAGVLHFLDDPVTALLDQRPGAIPMATLHGALQRTIAMAVDIGEDAVLLSKHLSAPSMQTTDDSSRLSPENPDIFLDAPIEKRLRLPSPVFPEDAALEVQVLVHPFHLGITPCQD